MGVLAEFIGEEIAGGTSPCSSRISSLSHEAWYHAVECAIVVKTFTSEEDEVVDSYRYILGE